MFYCIHSCISKIVHVKHTLPRVLPFSFSSIHVCIYRIIGMEGTRRGRPPIATTVNHHNQIRVDIDYMRYLHLSWSIIAESSRQQRKENAYWITVGHYRSALDELVEDIQRE
mmetsp:Transcript_2602/g.3929  ORF Transcript_2602/g.3929 Transcript_2602/m.3929 type:complete len:112 (+) Transcript_2602:43-378(+)